MIEAGSFVIFAGQLNYLLPHYYVLNALILTERTDAEWVFRNAVLKAQVAAGLLEIVWVGRRAQGLSLKACSLLAYSAALLEAVQVSLAFLAPAKVYNTTVALLLKCMSLFIQIPLAQVGTAYILRRRMSPARYRILAWLTACLVALIVLLDPRFANWLFALVVVTGPILVTAVVLQMFGKEEHGCSSADSMPPRVNSKGPMQADHMCTGMMDAGVFVLLGCLSGTIGEALTDMATTLAIRKVLKAGNTDLALTNQLMVLASMVLAYWSETKPSASGHKKAIFFISIWAGCQVFRVSALQHLEEGNIGKVLLGGMVFLDKYTGPLGSAALDVALLAVLTAGDARQRAKTSSRMQVPGSLLWTLRMTVTRMERPICQLLLLHSTGISVQWLSLIFTAITAAGVLLIVAIGMGVPREGSKDD